MMEVNEFRAVVVWRNEEGRKKGRCTPRGGAVSECASSSVITQLAPPRTSSGVLLALQHVPGRLARLLAKADLRKRGRREGMSGRMRAEGEGAPHPSQQAWGDDTSTILSPLLGPILVPPASPPCTSHRVGPPPPSCSATPYRSP